MQGSVYKLESLFLCQIEVRTFSDEQVVYHAVNFMLDASFFVLPDTVTTLIVNTYQIQYSKKLR